MSLNGLDDAKVKEAHDAAAAEPGGWFLLKYASRDEIELLGRGNGGIVEIRNAIASYEEASPLFGFLRYRRRNVVIKYVPDDCSRLVQARATVHFNAVTERFSPHDTVFPITTSKELRDTTLSAACSLHTASGSTSSSTSSLRRRRLMEIAEDAEEEVRAKRQSTVPEERPSTAKTPSISGQTVPLSPPPALPTGIAPSTSYRSMVSDAESWIAASKDPRESEIRSRSPTRELDEPRNSSQSTRPEMYSYSSYNSNGKPKVKLGPRPSLDVSGRPHTSGSASHYRPVSTLPAGLKLFSRASKTSKDRPKTQYPSEPPSMTISPPAIPDDTKSQQMNLNRPHTSGGRPTTSSGAPIKPLMSANVNTPKLPAITPEKARLMKAMELRKKQKQLAATPLPPTETLSPPINEELKSSTIKPELISETPQDGDASLAMLHDMVKEDDSGIAFDASSTLKTDESDATRSDSYPVSPVGPSERAESTRASSVSESTDETIQEAQSSKLPQENERKIPEQAAVQDTQPQTTSPTPAQTGAQAEEPSMEDLPLLLPVTYSPIPSPITVPQIHMVVDPTEQSAAATSAPAGQATQVNKEPTATSTFEVPQSETEIEREPLQQPQQVSVEEPPTVTDPEVISQRKVPKSKFSVQDPAAKTSPIPVSKFSVQDFGPPATNSVAAEPFTTQVALSSPVGSSFSIDTKRSVTEDEHDTNGLPSKRLKRRAMVKPIKTDIDLTDRSAANSDAHFSSDDDLMDELQSAVIQDAKPISVSKSPISPVFPSPKKTGKELNRFSRAFSSPIRINSGSKHLSPPTKTDSNRSISASAAYLNRIGQQSAQPLVKKVNLGSGISQRIKALEKLSSLTPGAAATQGSTGPTSGSSTSFFSVRKGNAGDTRSPSIAERANSLNRNTPSPTNSPDSSPETFKLRRRSGSIHNRLDAFTAIPAPPIRLEKSRPESISVTARIIRDPNQPFPTRSEVGKDPSEFLPLDLKESPLVIDHQRATSTPNNETIMERRLSTSSKASKATTKERRSSVTIVKDLINQGRASLSERRRSINLDQTPASPAILSPSRPPSTHTNVSSPGIHRPLSINSIRRSSSTRDVGGALSPPPTAGSSSSNGEEKEKKAGRASRMLRRMSSSISTSRKNIVHAMSPTVREESELSPHLQSPHPSLSSARPASASVNIGDVNVQFPDTLLWKRRSMILDSQGYLIISPTLTGHGNDRDKANAGAIRRYHLSAFRTPAIPDVEMQELPNSVVLDFVEGGGLQVACEDRVGQGHVLNILQEVHRTWAAYGQ